MCAVGVMRLQAYSRQREENTFFKVLEEFQSLRSQTTGLGGAAEI